MPTYSVRRTELDGVKPWNQRGRFDTYEDAREWVANLGGKVGKTHVIIPILSHEEAKRKFAAKVLREMADSLRVEAGYGKRQYSVELNYAATKLERNADELWKAE